VPVPLVAEPGSDGRVPIHLLLCGSEETAAMEAVRALVNPYPLALSCRDSDGNLPLHYAAGMPGCPSKS
jgi:hypothetical protein